VTGSATVAPLHADPLLVASALVYGATGLGLIFLPVEIVSAIGAGAAPAGVWMAQITGAALFALSQLNWMQRFAKVGGIFGRPVLIPNVVFATVAFFASVRSWRRDPERIEIAVAAAVLAVLGLLFAMRLLARPAAEPAA
jgi:hypothetical protein